VLVRTHMRRVAALRDDAGVGPFGAVGVEDDVGAVGLVVVSALLAVAAGEDLGADADALACFYIGDFGADADGCADDFYTSSVGII
jgi:hypothetical protein